MEFWLDKKNHAGGVRETGIQFGVAQLLLSLLATIITRQMYTAL